MPLFDDNWNKLLDQIEQRGWAWQIVHADGGEDGYAPFPSYCYTVGLAAKGLPDLIIVGLHSLPPAVAVAAGDELIMRALGAQPEPFVLNTALRDVFKGTRAMLVDVPYEHAANRSYFALDFAAVVEKPLQVIQLVWPDRNGRLPFEEGADPAFSETQPVLKYLPPPDPNQLECPPLLQ